MYIYKLIKDSLSFTIHSIYIIKKNIYSNLKFFSFGYENLYIIEKLNI